MESLSIEGAESVDIESGSRLTLLKIIYYVICAMGNTQKISNLERRLQKVERVMQDSIIIRKAHRLSKNGAIPTHISQIKILKLLERDIDVFSLSLRELGSLIEEEHPQKVKHHLQAVHDLLMINKEMGDNSSKDEDCKHLNRSWASYELTSYPPIRPWICKDCGYEGNERGTVSDSDYAKTKEKFAKNDEN